MLVSVRLEACLPRAPRPGVAGEALEGSPREGPSVERAARLLARMPALLLVADAPAHAQPVVVRGEVDVADELRAGRQQLLVQLGRRRLLQAAGDDLRVCTHGRRPAGTRRVADVLRDAARVDGGWDTVCTRLHLEVDAAVPRDGGAAGLCDTSDRVAEVVRALVLEPALLGDWVPHPRVALRATAHVERRLVLAARAAAVGGRRLVVVAAGLHQRSPELEVLPPAAVGRHGGGGARGGWAGGGGTGRRRRRRGRRLRMH
mmetsp:Transcript_20081/g.64503  ORF Transcript_20081/g.64503 Transcript_20081/m.64503 type:complete len:260 (-) Transcript_20081:40-819(-)